MLERRYYSQSARPNIDHSEHPEPYDIVERDGYVPRAKRIMQMMLAGKNLYDWRRMANPEGLEEAEDDGAMRVYPNDWMEAADDLKAANERMRQKYEARKAADEAIAAEASLAAVPAPEAVQPDGPAPKAKEA